MNCRRVKARLNAYAGRDLPHGEHAAVEMHLKGCLACYREFAGARASHAAICSLKESRIRTEEEREEFVDAVMQQVWVETPPRRRRTAQLLSMSGWVAAAAVFMVALVIRGPGATPEPLDQRVRDQLQTDPVSIPQGPQMLEHSPADLNSDGRPEVPPRPQDPDSAIPLRYVFRDF